MLVCLVEEFLSEVKAPELAPKVGKLFRGLLWMIGVAKHNKLWVRSPTMNMGFSLWINTSSFLKGIGIVVLNKKAILAESIGVRIPLNIN